MSVTTGMIGGGFYNRHSAPQASALAYVLPWLVEAATEMDFAPAPDAVALADFGCSEGQNSITAMKSVLPVLRSRTKRPFLTVHSDLPTNDFSQLLQALGRKDKSVLGDGNVYSAVISGSMFDQLLPSRSAHIAMTFNAIGFLSRRPLDRLPGYILPNGPSAVRNVGTVTDVERAAFATQARSDLDSFLRARGEELVPGGRLLIQVFGVGEAHRTCDGIYDVLNDAALDAVEAGAIDRVTYDSYYQPVYFRTLEELIAPFDSSTGQCADLFSLDRAECYEVPVPFVEDFKQTGDIATYASAYVQFLRAFTEPVLRLALGENSKVQKIVDGTYVRVEQLLMEHPERYPFNYLSVAAMLNRLS
jgi:gibberellin A4 carboxyl methyltransferase